MYYVYYTYYCSQYAVAIHCDSEEPDRCRGTTSPTAPNTKYQVPKTCTSESVHAISTYIDNKVLRCVIPGGSPEAARELLFELVVEMMYGHGWTDSHCSLLPAPAAGLLASRETRNTRMRSQRGRGYERECPSCHTGRTNKRTSERGTGALTAVDVVFPPTTTTTTPGQSCV